MDFNEFLDNAFNANKSIEKVAEAEPSQRAVAIEIIKQAALEQGEELSDEEVESQSTEHLVKVAEALIGDDDAGQEEPAIELSPRLQQLFESNPEALEKFAGMDPDHQHMVVCGDIMGETAARSFLAAIEQAQNGYEAEPSEEEIAKIAELEEQANQLAYQYLYESGQLRPEHVPEEEQGASEEDVIRALAQQKVAAYLGNG